MHITNSLNGCFSGKKFTVEYIAVAIVVSLLLMLSVLVILYYKRLCNLHNKVPGKNVGISYDTYSYISIPWVEQTEVKCLILL